MSKTLLCALVALVVISGCVPQSVPPAEETLPKSVGSIVVLPVEFAADSAVSPQAKQQLQDGVETLSQAVSEVLAVSPKVRMLNEDEVEALTSGYQHSSSAQAQAIGRGLHAEAVMLWEVQRFQQRLGTEYAVQSPASLAFTYRLLHLESGQTLCAGSFDETQQAATENLLSFKTLANRGFKWITASDLAREGVGKKMADCAYWQEARP